ncbi:hypothetical protein [Nannocystis punicea]|uniref:Uncharacterized protein n=1 Tax=Nannocystis punicea TaxID=2995304 RepID=A0ABY7H4N7_9BACT|nr:hypothetical protein [Nannocystis poenicansa]WAS94226.1 hypothetical protein O0S08_49520 [Nannocystis poenicansa]
MLSTPLVCALSAGVPDPAGPAAPPAPVSPPVMPQRSAYRMQLTGAVLLAFGAVTLVGMGAAIGYGRGIDRERREALDEGAAPAELEALQRRGARADAAAIATGVVGVALAGTAIALFVTAERWKRRAITIHPGPGLLGLSLHARF